MAQVVFNHVGGKPPFFDGVTSFDHWKRKMKQYLGSIHEKVWDVTCNEYAIIDPDNLTNNDRTNNQCNTMALNTLYNGIGAKLYMLKDKFASFKMKDDESIPEMFYRLQVIVNDLKSLGENVKDKDFSHKFLMNLPKKFAILRKMI
jgi:hypothetical protein